MDHVFLPKGYVRVSVVSTIDTIFITPFPGKLIMVIGGSAARNTRDWVDDIEIVSTDPGTTPVPDCLRELNPFPLGTIYYGAGALTAPGMYHRNPGLNEPLLYKDALI